MTLFLGIASFFLAQTGAPLLSVCGGALCCASLLLQERLSQQGLMRQK